MSHFINEPSLRRQYTYETKPKITSIGYDDFAFVQPWKFYRVQDTWTLHLVLSGKGVFFIGVEKL